MNSKGRDSSRSKPFRVGFPNKRPPLEVPAGKFPLLDRVLPLSEKITNLFGQQCWISVLNAVKKCEAEGTGFDSLPEKVRQLIEDAER